MGSAKLWLQYTKESREESSYNKEKDNVHWRTPHQCCQSPGHYFLETGSRGKKVDEESCESKETSLLPNLQVLAKDHFKKNQEKNK